jgi:biotin synthase
MASLAPRALGALTRPAASAPLLRNVRGHAAAIEQPSFDRPTHYEEGAIRHNWRRSEIQKIFDGPLMETVFRAVSPLPCNGRERIARRGTTLTN